MTPSHALIRLQGVTKSYGDDPALSRIDLDIGSGEFLTFLGPSGCGKTTILRLIAGFETPTSGTVFIDGKSMNGLPPHKRKVNTVFQSYALFPHMTVFDNVAFGLKMAGVSSGEIRRRVGEVLETVHMDGMAKRRPDELSGGQQQRVAIARAVVNNPLVLLLDEPLSALDARLRRKMQMELKELQKNLGITFVFVTHDQEEAFSMSDRIVVMRRGGIQQIGTPVEIYEEPANLYVAEFVGETNIFRGRVTGRRKGGLDAVVEGRPCSLASNKPFAEGDQVLVLLRPEDLVFERTRPQDGSGPWFEGTVDDTLYKGTTYDITATLDQGRRILITKFFDEDAEDMQVVPGDRIHVSWIRGWEVVLPDAT